MAAGHDTRGLPRASGDTTQRSSGVSPRQEVEHVEFDVPMVPPGIDEFQRVQTLHASATLQMHLADGVIVALGVLGDGAIREHCYPLSSVRWYRLAQR